MPGLEGEVAEKLGQLYEEYRTRYYALGRRMVKVQRKKKNIDTAVQDIVREAKINGLIARRDEENARALIRFNRLVSLEQQAQLMRGVQ